VLGRLADKLRRLYAAALPPARRERVRARLAAAAASTLERRGLDGAADVLPPNNARLLGLLLYATRLEEFEALAPGDADPGPGLRALVAAARGERNPFRVLAGLATPRANCKPAGDRRKVTVAWQARTLRQSRFPPSRSTRCSAGWPAGSGSSATTWPTGRI
jgi:hypothetical protein